MMIDTALRLEVAPQPLEVSVEAVGFLPLDP